MPYWHGCHFLPTTCKVEAASTSISSSNCSCTGTQQINQGVTYVGEETYPLRTHLVGSQVPSPSRQLGCTLCFMKQPSPRRMEWLLFAVWPFKAVQIYSAHPPLFTVRPFNSWQIYSTRPRRGYCLERVSFSFLFLQKSKYIICNSYVPNGA